MRRGVPRSEIFLTTKLHTGLGDPKPKALRVNRESCFSLESFPTRWVKLNGTNRAEFAVFADFCRFSLFLGIIAFRRRRFSQETADFRRKPQKTADFRRNRFVPFIRTFRMTVKIKFDFRTPACFFITVLKLLTSSGQHRCVKHQHIFGNMVLKAHFVFLSLLHAVFLSVCVYSMNTSASPLGPRSVPIHATQCNSAYVRIRWSTLWACQW